MERGVIEFDRVTKVYPGATAPSVEDLTFTIEAGEICALVGPSGSGKTTAMRMVNRLIDPTNGAIRIDGVDNRSMDEETLRRSIGYVIQQVGLFPHRTVLDNVATVPRLLGWDENTIRTRSHELLELVGLDPNAYGNRYPSQLSGGQRQRVGVARALAADPPVMLMDEPFGAIDPVVRGQIQDEFLRMQQEVRKTIIIVTHDLDEAMLMGDKVLILQEGGKLGQYGSPTEILARPNSDFTREFVGSDVALRLLSLTPVRDLPLIPLDVAASQGFGMMVNEAGHPVAWTNNAPIGCTINASDNLRNALSELMMTGTPYAPVVDDHGRPIALVTSELIQNACSDLQNAPSNPQVEEALQPQHGHQPPQTYQHQYTAQQQQYGAAGA